MVLRKRLYDQDARDSKGTMARRQVLVSTIEHKRRHRPIDVQTVMHTEGVTGRSEEGLLPPKQKTKKAPLATAHKQEDKSGVDWQPQG